MNRYVKRQFIKWSNNPESGIPKLIISLYEARNNNNRHDIEDCESKISEVIEKFVLKQLDQFTIDEQIEIAEELYEFTLKMPERRKVRIKQFIHYKEDPLRQLSYLSNLMYQNLKKSEIEQS